MSNFIKLYEEFFWETKDNDVAGKIIGYLNNIDVNNLSCNSELDDVGKLVYEYIIDRGVNHEDDPFDEEFWEEDQIKIRAIRHKELPFGNNWYEVFVDKNERQIKLKTNKASKIFSILRKSYKENKRRRDREELEDI